MFNFAKKIIVETDVNRITLGAILSQLDGKNRLYPVIFYSRKFTVLELNYLFIYLFKFYVHMRPCGYDRRPITSLAMVRTLTTNTTTERQLQ